jgi:type I restriction enzyme R subunit
MDKRLAGIQAVQTLSRLNRAYRGPFGKKDTTYVLDFVNDPQEILQAFKTYYQTAELEHVTDPNLVYDLLAQLNASGHYDDNEVERVVRVELDPQGTQRELAAAIEPVADRLLKQYRAAQQAWRAGQESGDAKAEQAAQDEMNALQLFKKNLGVYLRGYAFLSQIFDYGNTAVEKRAMFFKRLLPLLEFGRERETIDLSRVVLTHHRLRNLGKAAMPLMDQQYPKLKPMDETGTHEIRDPAKELLAQIIAQVNDLFQGDLTDGDKLRFVEHLKGKLLESETLAEQADSNTENQFANSPDLDRELMNAIMDALAAHTSMSTQTLDSERVRRGLRDILLGPAQLYEALRARGAGDRPLTP